MHSRKSGNHAANVLPLDRIVQASLRKEIAKLHEAVDATLYNIRILQEATSEGVPQNIVRYFERAQAEIAALDMTKRSSIGYIKFKSVEVKKVCEALLIYCQLNETSVPAEPDQLRSDRAKLSPAPSGSAKVH